MRISRVATVVGVLVTLTSSAVAGMPRVFQRYMRMFDGDYQRLAGDFETVTDSNRATLEGYLRRLSVHLDKVPGSYHSDPDYSSRRAKLDALEAKLRGGAATPTEGEGLPGPLAKADQVYGLAEQAMGGWTHADLGEARATLQEVQEGLRAVKRAQRDHGDHPQYSGLRSRGAELYAALRQRISELEAAERQAARAQRGAARAATSRVAAPGVEGKSDAEIAREFQGAYDALSNDIRRTRGPAMVDPETVAGFQARFEELEAMTGAYEDPSQGFARQTRASYESLRRWYDTSLEGARRRYAEHLEEQAEAAAARERAAATASHVPKADPGAAPSELDYQARRALQFYDRDQQRYERDFASIDSDDVEDLSSKLERLENRLDKVPERFRGHPEVARRAAQLEAWSQALAAAVGAKQPLTAEERGHLEEFQGLWARNQFLLRNAVEDPRALLDEGERERVTALLARLEEPLAKITNVDHPDVVDALETLAPLRAAVRGASAEADAMSDSLGDVDAQLELLRSQFPYRDFDPEYVGNGTPASVASWAQRLKDLRQASDDGKAYLRKLDDLNVRVAAPDFERYKTWFPRVELLIDAAVDEKRKEWSRKVRGALGQLGVRPDAMSEGHARAFAARLQGVVPDFDRLQELQRVYDGRVDPDLDADRERLEGLIARLLGSADSRVERARLPAPQVAQTPDLLDRAREILRNPKYEIEGEIRGLRVTTHPSRETRVRFFDGTWYTEDWDEYHVAFAHHDSKAGGRWFKSFGTLKFFREAWRTTPQGEWILANFWHSEEMLEQNID